MVLIGSTTLHPWRMHGICMACNMMDSCMVFAAGLNKAGYRSRTHCMAGHSKTRCPLIMDSMQIAPL